MKVKNKFLLYNLPQATIIELDEHVSQRELSYEELDKLNLEREKNEHS